MSRVSPYKQQYNTETTSSMHNNSQNDVISTTFIPFLVNVHSQTGKITFATFKKSELKLSNPFPIFHKIRCTQYGQACNTLLPSDHHWLVIAKQWQLYSPCACTVRRNHITFGSVRNNYLTILRWLKIVKHATLLFLSFCYAPKTPSPLFLFIPKKPSFNDKVWTYYQILVSKQVKSQKTEKTGPPTNPAIAPPQKFLSLLWCNLFTGVNEMRVKILPLLCRLGLVLRLESVYLVLFVSTNSFGASAPSSEWTICAYGK